MSRQYQADEQQTTKKNPILPDQLDRGHGQRLAYSPRTELEPLAVIALIERVEGERPMNAIERAHGIKQNRSRPELKIGDRQPGPPFEIENGSLEAEETQETSHE